MAGATPTLSLVTTGSTVTLSPTKAADVSQQSSLRVEEVGTVQLTVGGKLFQSTLTQLTDFATTDGGFVSSTQSHIGSKATHTYSSGTIVLQVPERNFTMLVNQVRHAGVASSVSTSATDVTGQYVDLQARIRALQVSRAQYLTIMTRTNSIGGILAVQNQLNTIQSQIEQLQGQLGLLNSETTYATLTVSLSQAGHLVVPLALQERCQQGVARLTSWFRRRRRMADPNRRTTPVRTSFTRRATCPWPLDLACH